MQRFDRAQTESPPDEDAYTVGAILRDAREASGEDIENISRTLRINKRYLEALEDGRLKDLPGTAYAIGFIRSYANYLNLDGAEMITRHKEASESGARETTLDFPEPLPETGVPGGVVLFAGIVVAVLAYGGWYFGSESDTSLTDLVAPVPEDLASGYGENETVVEAAREPATSDAGLDAVDQNLAAIQSVTGTEAAALENDVVGIESGTAEDAGAAGAEQDSPEPTEQESAETGHVGTTPVDEAAGDTIGAEEGPTAGAAGNSGSDTTEGGARTRVENTAENTVEGVPTEEPGQGVHTATNGSDDARSLNEQQLLAAQVSLGAVTVTETTAESDTVTTPSPTGDPDTENTSYDTVHDTISAPSEVASAGTSADGTGTDADGVETERTPRVYGETGDVRIVITATADSWAEVRDTSLDELLLTRLLRVGDSFRVPDRPDLVLATGNAGGLEIMVDGAVVPPVGGDGHIRRDVRLDPDLLVAGEAGN